MCRVSYYLNNYYINYSDLINVHQIECVNLFLELRCSLAHFVEGNDIARMSFKKKPRHCIRKTEEESDLVKIQFKGSNGDLTKEWNEKFNEEFKSVRLLNSLFRLYFEVLCSRLVFKVF